MRKLYFILITAVALLATACEFKLKPNGEDGHGALVEVQRYDRLESRYLTTGDFSALQQMNIDYPMETRTLIEDVLQLGEVNDPEINSKFLNFYQDTILQSIVADAEAQYANMNDINMQFCEAFERLCKMCPEVKVPVIYTQIGALDQSIVIGDSSIGISLDKYLGSNYLLYRRYYTDNQRATMKREYIVPDALCFYLLSIFPLKNHDQCSQYDRDLHMGKIMWVVNKAVGRNMFKTKFTAAVDTKMKECRGMQVSRLLSGGAQR